MRTKAPHFQYVYYIISHSQNNNSVYIRKKNWIPALTSRICLIQSYVFLQLWVKQEWKGCALAWHSLHPTPPQNLWTVAMRQPRSLSHHQLSDVVLSSGLQAHKHWQWEIMLLTHCATSLFMRTDSLLRMAAHQQPLSTVWHTCTGRQCAHVIHSGASFSL